VLAGSIVSIGTNLTAGSGISLTPSATTDTITIANTATGVASINATPVPGLSVTGTTAVQIVPLLTAPLNSGLVIGTSGNNLQFDTTGFVGVRGVEVTPDVVLGKTFGRPLAPLTPAPEEAQYLFTNATAGVPGGVAIGAAINTTNHGGFIVLNATAAGCYFFFPTSDALVPAGWWCMLKINGTNNVNLQNSGGTASAGVLTAGETYVFLKTTQSASADTWKAY